MTTVGTICTHDLYLVTIHRASLIIFLCDKAANLDIMWMTIIDDRWKYKISPKSALKKPPEIKDDLRRYSQHYFLGRKKSAQKVPINITDRNIWSTC